MNTSSSQVIVCNGASTPDDVAGDSKVRFLDYGNAPDRDRERNLTLNLPGIARSDFPDRVLDLIELAVYIHAGDRLAGRGRANAAELHGWQRRFRYRIRVRDYNFWSSGEVKKALSEVVAFMTGDKSYTFEFEAGHATAQRGLFASEDFEVNPRQDAQVVLFSGGLDSLTGAVDRLKNSSGEVYLVSHRAQPSIKKTQRELVKALAGSFPNRISHYTFDSHLRGIKAREETQRSRSLLFGSLAYAIAHAAGRRSFYLYENGITGINFPKRQNLMNARASRTTHPRTVRLLEHLFSLVQEDEITIQNPFLYLTKTDVLERLKEMGFEELYTSAVSCGITRSKQAPATHCGGCNQCIDRRFAAYAAGIDDYDDSAHYEQDFIREGVEDRNGQKSLLDFLRQAGQFANESADDFEDNHANELVELFEHLPDSAGDDLSTIEKIHRLCRRHGAQVWNAYKRIYALHSNPSKPTPENSVFAMVGADEHLAEPFEAGRLVERLQAIDSGHEQARDYEKLMEEIIHALFVPYLVAPRAQVADANRKNVVDLTMRISASSGFWSFVQTNYGNLVVPFEFKNKENLANPDFDQIARRLNDKKGEFGVLVSRNVQESDEEAISTWLHNGKAILPLDDDDIITMLLKKEQGESPSEYMEEKMRTVLERVG
jgi:7-cyano-7-deazaguanine synthase in queuosine biosynthesis